MSPAALTRSTAPVAFCPRRPRPLFVALVGLLGASLTFAAAPVEQTVRDEIRSRLAGAAHNVRVESPQPGRVTLQGNVTNLRQRQQAEEAAARVSGVAEVINEITVNTPSRPDAELEDDVAAALEADPATEALNIGVSASSGVVTLAGPVDTWPQARLAAWIASGVRGVRQVENALQLRLVQRPDNVIQEQLQEHFAESGLFSDLRVIVQDGHVALHGEVNSRLQRTWAEQDAWVRGVRGVDVTGIQVRPTPLAPPPLQADRDDESLRRAVLDAFVYDTRVRSVQPDVQVDDGVVTLSGEVSNLKAKEAAEQLARHTPGVKRVENQLTVEPTRSLPDAEIRRLVEAQYQRSAGLAHEEIEVQVQQGHVTLSGNVSTTAARWEAADLAARTTGVTEITNELNVTPEPDSGLSNLVYYPTGTAPEPWFRNAPIGRPEGDDELLQAVRSQLESDPLVNAQTINIDVLNGTVTLTGTVGGWLERSVAEDNAFQAGAGRVDNRLRTPTAAE